MRASPSRGGKERPGAGAALRRGDDTSTVGSHHRAQFSQFEFFEAKLFSIEQFEPTVSQSTVSCTPPGGGGSPRG